MTSLAVIEDEDRLEQVNSKVVLFVHGLVYVGLKLIGCTQLTVNRVSIKSA